MQPLIAESESHCPTDRKRVGHAPCRDRMAPGIQRLVYLHRHVFGMPASRIPWKSKQIKPGFVLTKQKPRQLLAIPYSDSGSLPSPPGEPPVTAIRRSPRMHRPIPDKSPFLSTTCKNNILLCTLAPPFQRPPNPLGASAPSTSPDEPPASPTPRGLRKFFLIF